MDVNAIMQLVGSLGFPIVMCGALFWKMNKNEEANRASNEKMVEAVNNNTIAITKLVTKFGADREG